MSDETLGGAVAPAAEETTSAATDHAAPQAGATEAPAGDEQAQAEKAFTKAEVEALVEKELAKKTAKLLRQRDQERARREIYEQELTKVKIQPQQIAGEPQPEQFDDPRQYAKAVVEFERQKESATRAQQQQVQQQSSFASRVDDLVADLEEAGNFDRDKWQRLPISTAMAHAILDSDMSVKVAEHFLQHPDDASRIANLTPARQAAEIGKLEAKLSTATKPKSNAPPPLQPVKAAATSAEPNPKTDPEGWIKWRNKQSRS